MSKYPTSIELPSFIHDFRAKRDKEVVRASVLGIKIRCAIIIFEIVGVVLIHSSALFLDVLATLMDVVSSIFLIFCVKLAQRPPDQNHPFGHGRYEPLGGMLLGILLLVIGGIMFANQVLSLFQEETRHLIHPLGWLFPAITIVLLEISYRYIRAIAKQETSPALMADAVHYRIDSLNSFFAMIALAIGAYWPAWGGITDQIGALVIALFMVGVGAYATRENMNQLMDRIPDQEFFDRVKKAAARVKGLLGTEKIRIQQYGPDAHVDIDIEVSPDLSVDKAHQISQEVRVEIQKEWPAVRDVTVHVEPYYANDH
jgi:cation diffusion facilitator family transporter